MTLNDLESCDISVQRSGFEVFWRRNKSVQHRLPQYDTRAPKIRQFNTSNALFRHKKPSVLHKKNSVQHTTDVFCVELTFFVLNWGVCWTDTKVVTLLCWTHVFKWRVCWSKGDPLKITKLNALKYGPYYMVLWVNFCFNSIVKVSTRSQQDMTYF